MDLEDVEEEQKKGVNVVEVLVNVDQKVVKLGVDVLEEEDHNAEDHDAEDRDAEDHDAEDQAKNLIKF